VVVAVVVVVGAGVVVVVVVVGSGVVVVVVVVGLGVVVVVVVVGSGVVVSYLQTAVQLNPFLVVLSLSVLKTTSK